MKNTKINGQWELKIPLHRQENWRNCWEVERIQALSLCIKQGDVVYDIGAEEGDITALMASWGAQVVAIEPSPNYWPTIRRTFEANNLKLKDYFVGFLSNETIIAEVDYDSDDRNGWPECAYGRRKPKVGFRHLSQQADVTDQTTVDNLAKSVPPNILNIDVEGAELEVLKGAEETLITLRPIVFVSVHPEFMTLQYIQSSHDLFNFMHGLGYSHIVLGYDHEWHVQFTPRSS